MQVSLPSKPSRRTILIGGVGSQNGGGGESDAAFTPSPPTPVSSFEGVGLTLPHHQARIRNLYPVVQSSANVQENNNKLPALATTSQLNYPQHRPDSSSSASSATDWEG